MNLNSILTHFQMYCKTHELKFCQHSHFVWQKVNRPGIHVILGLNQVTLPETMRASLGPTVWIFPMLLTSHSSCLSSSILNDSNLLPSFFFLVDTEHKTRSSKGPFNLLGWTVIVVQDRSEVFLSKE